MKCLLVLLTCFEQDTANIYKLRTVDKATSDFDLETNAGQLMSEIHHIERIITTRPKPPTGCLMDISTTVKPNVHHHHPSIQKSNPLPSLIFILSYPRLR